MKKYFTAIIIILCAGFISNEKQTVSPFQKLYALEGKWIMKTKKGSIGEAWTKVSKDHLQSLGYMIRGADTIITEKVSLTNTGEGIFYTSVVQNENNQQPVAFKLTSSNNNIFVFENLQHDYPKRISYHFIKKDSINAWIDDGKKVPEMKSVFMYSRQKLNSFNFD